jgi:hypothetical protein
LRDYLRQRLLGRHNVEILLSTRQFHALLKTAKR